MSETTNTTTTDGTANQATPPSSSEGAPPSTSAPPSSSPPPSGADTPSQGTSDGKSPSSGDTHQSDREGLLAAVRAVVKPSPEKSALPATGEPDHEPGTEAEGQGAAEGDKGAPSADKSASQQTAQPDKDTDDPNAPDPSEAELKKLRPETRKRFERLLAQRNTARTELERLQPELAQHRQLQGYLRDAQLAADDVNVLLGVGAALRRQDYQGFLNGVLPYVFAAQEALGQRIAPDLQKQVDDGAISEDAGREMTRTRHRAAQAEFRLNQQTEVHRAQTQTQQIDAIRQRIERWELNVRSRDPDYPAIAGAHRRFSQALMQERGIPQTPEQAEALVQMAYDEARKELVRLRPAPQPTRQAPTGTQSAMLNGAGDFPVPKTPKEAALQALARMRRAS